MSDILETTTHAAPAFHTVVLPHQPDPVMVPTEDTVLPDYMALQILAPTGPVLAVGYDVDACLRSFVETHLERGHIDPHVADPCPYDPTRFHWGMDIEDPTTDLLHSFFGAYVPGGAVLMHWQIQDLEDAMDVEDATDRTTGAVRHPSVVHPHVLSNAHASGPHLFPFWHHVVGQVRELNWYAVFLALILLAILRWIVLGDA